MNHEERIKQIVEIAYDRLCGKITGQRIEVSNEASLQLQLASILKTLGELYEETPDERFIIELEKNVTLGSGTFVKSKTEKAKIDIWFSLENVKNAEKHSCAIELKYFKKTNHREPNNRYDVFKDLHNLERYGGFVNAGYLLVATDHPHYINQDNFSPDTGDFDFREGRSYSAGTELLYRTSNPYGPPITLKGTYDFSWRAVETGLSFLFIRVDPWG
ncbi:MULTISPECIES: hypothetical protein [Halomonadaceae]|uniref:hypothetical protein n=1 Tax=Halomonadaceae TaxID=28256 RepID=UPI000C32D2EF|nr:hypothetical protein [Halomonas sp. MES3-P3E]PKG54947.1 hypothetical protein CXF87_00225 [Halomonas sp. MES3-P3E]|tara:strand:- start:3524 stop:4174 length:651 start_codon:yes stop_codon:yes gene_type:complete